MAEQPLPDAADAILLAQWVLRNLAHREGQRLTTAPMMLEGHAGNGLHFHFAFHENGKHLEVRRDSGELTDPARWLIGGLVQMGGALMAFGNRVEGSFARLLQAKEAPNSIVWGDFDRSALVRLPVVPTDASGRTVGKPTVEFRLPDGSALPHLLMAGAALAMVLGHDTEDLDTLLERTSSTKKGAETVAAPVPRSFDEVADAVFSYRDALMSGGVFPEGYVDALVERMKG
jgi:glutamine synthetase